MAASAEVLHRFRLKPLLTLVGNLNQPVETLVQNAATDLFNRCAKEFDLAVIDRIHFYMPGYGSSEKLQGHPHYPLRICYGLLG